MDNKKDACVVVLSGGQDSVTCLGVALGEYKQVHCICFSYGQKHTVEIICARKICDMYENVTFEIVQVPALSFLNDSALISGNHTDVNELREDKLPASFVPNRNALFLTIAHAYAQKMNAQAIITGVCQTDYSGYPDCRLSFIKAMEAALNAGSNQLIKIETPLMELTKAQTFQLAEEVGILDVVINMSHTCYNGKRGGEFYHYWGHGCGECPACKLRKKGWEEYVDGIE